jgi:hypothetical protein
MLCRFLKTGDATEKDGCRKKNNEGHEGLFSTCYIFAILFVCHTVSLILYVYPTGLLLLEAFRGMTVVGFIWYFYVENTNLSLERIYSCLKSKATMITRT